MRAWRLFHDELCETLGSKIDDGDHEVRSGGTIGEAEEISDVKRGNIVAIVAIKTATAFWMYLSLDSQVTASSIVKRCP